VARCRALVADGVLRRKPKLSGGGPGQVPGPTRGTKPLRRGTRPVGKLSDIAHTICCALPARYRRVLRRPAIVPGTYRHLVREFEYAAELVANRGCLDDNYWCAVLRKQAHILDKGLQRLDREPCHGACAYRQAVEALGMIEGGAARCDPSVRWAVQTIRRYERLQEEGAVDCADPPNEDLSHLHDGLVRVIRSRRSIRRFGDRLVEDGVLHRIATGLDWSATSCNRQPACVFVTNDPVLARECSTTWKGVTGFGESIPAFLVFCADLRPYSMPQEALLPTLDVALGVQNCCLMATVLGLSLVLLSWALHTEPEEERLRTLLGIPRHYQIVVGGALGYPECGAQVPERKAHSVYHVRPARSRV